MNDFNAWLAEHLFGATGDTVPDNWKWWGVDEEGARYARRPTFYTDIALAIDEIVPAMRKKGWRLQRLAQQWNHNWVAEFIKLRTVGLSMHAEAEYNTAAGAICLAVKAAIE